MSTRGGVRVDLSSPVTPRNPGLPGPEGSAAPVSGPVLTRQWWRPSTPRAARARLRQAAVRLARWVHLARSHAGGRAQPGGARGTPALRAASTGRPGARGTAPRRSGANHTEEGLRRRDDRGRHGPAVAVVPVGHQRAPAASAHHALRGRAGPGEPVPRRGRRPRFRVARRGAVRRIGRAACCAGRCWVRKTRPDGAAAGQARWRRGATARGDHGAVRSARLAGWARRSTSRAEANERAGARSGGPKVRDRRPGRCVLTGEPPLYYLALHRLTIKAASWHDLLPSSSRAR